MSGKCMSYRNVRYKKIIILVKYMGVSDNIVYEYIELLRYVRRFLAPHSPQKAGQFLPAQGA